MSRFKDRVDKGVALLDERVPGWRSRIDREKLNMLHLSDCVLGQLFGGFKEGMQEFFGGNWFISDANVVHGFAAANEDYDYMDVWSIKAAYVGLTQEWLTRLG